MWGTSEVPAAASLQAATLQACGCNFAGQGAGRSSQQGHQAPACPPVCLPLSKGAQVQWDRVPGRVGVPEGRLVP